MSERQRGIPERVGVLVDNLLRARGLSEGVERAAVFTDWPELVGPQIARVARPVRCDRETLFVEVRSSAWLMELELMEHRILARLNSERRRGKFKRIIFRLSATG